MSEHFAGLIRWEKIGWKVACAESEASFQEPVLNEHFRQEDLEFQFDAVIDRILRYAAEVGLVACEESEEASLRLNRFTTPCRTIVVVGNTSDPDPLIPGVLYRTLASIPYPYRIVVDMMDATVLFYADGRARWAARTKAGSTWVRALAGGRIPG